MGNTKTIDDTTNAKVIDDTTTVNVAVTLGIRARSVTEVQTCTLPIFTAGVFNSLTGTSAGNYSAPSFAAGHTLTITPASLTGSIADQTKVYGANEDRKSVV